jgi:hypothetical protein
VRISGNERHKGSSVRFRSVNLLASWPLEHTNESPLTIAAIDGIHKY